MKRSVARVALALPAMLLTALLLPFGNPAPASAESGAEPTIAPAAGPAAGSTTYTNPVTEGVTSTFPDPTGPEF